LGFLKESLIFPIYFFLGGGATGDGVEVSRKIIARNSVQNVDKLYRRFVLEERRYREELVFAAWVFKLNRLGGKSLAEAWIDISNKAMEHGQRIGNPKFYNFVLKDIQETHVDLEI